MNIEHKRTFLLAQLSLFIVLLCVFGSYVFAVDQVSIKTNSSIKAGNLFLSPPKASIHFGKIKMNGTFQKMNGTLGDLRVSDFRAHNEGWHVTVSATPLTQINAKDHPPLTLPINSLRLNGIESITQVSGEKGKVSVSGTPPWTIDSGPVTILSAKGKKSRGGFLVKFGENSLNLNIDTTQNIIDHTAEKTIYSTKITWDVTSGP